MKNIIYKYLKTCVLSACVAALCGGRAFGGYFWCEECDKPILDEDWGSHNVKLKHGNKMPEVFVCIRCYVNKAGVPQNMCYHYQDQCTSVKKVGGEPELVPPFEEHVRLKHRRWEYTFWCSKCRRQIDVNSWITHLYWECTCYNGIYKFEGLDLMEEERFRCLLCKGEGKKAVFPLILKYEHLRDNHRNCLPERKFFCKSCKETVSEANWQEHRKKKHKTIEEFYCRICKKTRRECYEEHMATCHAGQCSFPFCQEKFLEEKRKEHMGKEHGFPCPICDRRIDTPLEVHVDREHPCFEGHCKFQKLRRDSKGTYRYEPCEWPCYRVSGCDYIQHLFENVHGVGKNAENKEAFFQCCPHRDFVGQPDEFKKHVNLKHKGYSFDCQKCNRVDVWRNEEQHRQVEHEKTHWWCYDCAKIFQYKSKDEKERSAFRNEHLLTMHEDIYAKCPGCGDVVSMKKLGSHAKEKHPEKFYFWCFLCGGYKEGKQSEHMKGTHHYCEICETWVSNPSDHHNEKHKDCFFCRLCHGSFKDRAEHTKNVHKDVKFCACGAWLALFQVYESWHVDKHSVHCPLCKKAQPLSHMVTAHECKEGVCKPIASTEELTWKWQCDPSCKNFIVHCPLCKKAQPQSHMVIAHECKKDVCKPIASTEEPTWKWQCDPLCKNLIVHCPLCKEAQPQSHMVIAHECKKDVCKPIASTEELTWKWQCDPSCKNLIKPCPLEKIRGCQFTGSAEQLTVHMRDEHKCEETCRFNVSGDFVHGVSCRNGPAYCSLCNGNVENRVLHWMNKHECVEGCPIAIGKKGKWHQAYCREWTLSRCPRCWEQDVDRKHIFKHFSTCGEGCYLIQDGEGWVSIQHQGHSEENEPFASQDYGEEEDVVIEYEPEENYIDDLEGDQGE